MTIKEKIAIEVMRYQCTLTDIRERKTEGLWIADQILSTIIEEIRDMENPFRQPSDSETFIEAIAHCAYQSARQAIIARLEEA